MPLMPATNQPRAMGTNSPPCLLDKAITREEANIPDHHLEWANRFAVLRDEAIGYFARWVPRLGLDAALRSGWKPLYLTKNCYCLALRDGNLFVDQWDAGWVIQLEYFAAPHKRARVLTFSYLVEWPVLCPSFEAAAQLAEACFPHPDPETQLWWHAYW